MERRSTFVRLVTLMTTAFVNAACSGSDAGGVSTPPAPPVEQIVVAISAKNDSLLLGSSRALSASVTNGSGVARNVPVTWSSLSPAIATVSNGVVTALATGEAQIVASAGTGADTARFKVYPPVVALQLTPGAVDATLGDTIRFEATIVGPTGGATRATDIAWALSDSSTAQFVGAGTVATRDVGTVNVMATVSGRTATAAVQVRSASVASISIVPNNLSLAVGTSATLAAELRDARGRIITGQTVTWSSSRTSVAVIEKSGLVHALVEGGSIITATAGGKSATAAVNVYSAGATSVSLVLPNDSLGTGRTMQAVAQPLDANGQPLTGRTIAWQSSNPAVATVNSSGLITAIAAGQSTISVICDGKTASQKLTAALPVPTTIAVTPSAATMMIGTSSRLTADVRDQFDFSLAGQTVSWSSNATSIATVNSTGSVTGVSAGTATIRATSGSLSATSSVTVQNVPVATVTVSPEVASVDAGDVLTLRATARDSAGNILSNRLVTWSSSATAYATVSSTGTVSGVAVGSAVVTATVEGKIARAFITVTAPAAPAVAKVTLTLNSTSLNVGQVTSAVARVYDASGNQLSVPVTYASSAPSIASVASDGRVTALAAGSAAITASADTASGIASVAVAAPLPAPVDSVALSAPTTSLTVGDSTQLSVTLLDSTKAVLTGRTISYSTSNSLVAAVSAGGKVYAIGAGSARITAASGSASSALDFTVASKPAQAPSVATVTVTLAQSALVVGQGTQASAVLRDSTGATMTGTIAWSSSNTAVATVSQSGSVTVVGAGSAVITASSGGKTGNATLTATAPVVTVKTVTVTFASSSIVAGTTTTVTAIAKDSTGAVVSGRTVSWSTSAASIATLSASSTGSTTATGVATGTATISATIGGVTGSNVLTVTAPPPPPSSTITLPTLPTLLNVSYPRVTGKSWPVRAGDNLQSILNQAQRGDEIVLDAGVTFTGNFTLPVKTGTAANGWILIRSSQSASLPPQGTRVTAAQAPLMPKLVSASVAPALATTPSTSGWWISGIEFSIAPTVTSVIGRVVALGSSGAAQNTLAAVPSDIVLDRVYIHPQSNQNVQRCLELNSARTAVQDSYLVECHASGYDSQAIVAWNGPGPFRIVNNTLQGAGENIMFGGADPSISGLIPGDAEIRNNYIYTPASWKGVWTKKNLFETKNAQRLLIEGNVLEGSWTDGQVGYAFLLKVANQSGNCTWCTTSDITIRNNIIRNVGGAFGITGKEGGNPNPIGALLHRLLIENNWVENVNVAPYTGDARMVSIMQNPSDVTIRSNTMSTTGTIAQYINIGTQNAATNFAFQNNIANYGSYGLFSSWFGIGETPNLQAFAGTVLFQNSVLIGASKSGYPNASFVSSLSAALSTGRGANQATVNSATQGVVIP